VGLALHFNSFPLKHFIPFTLRVSLLLVLACPIIVIVIIFVLYLHRACLVATIRSSGASQSTIKLVATNLIASGKLAGELVLCTVVKPCSFRLGSNGENPCALGQE